MATLLNSEVHNDWIVSTDSGLAIPIKHIHLVEDFISGGTAFRVRAGNQRHTIRFEDVESAQYFRDKLRRKL